MKTQAQEQREARGPRGHRCPWRYQGPAASKVGASRHPSRLGVRTGVGMHIAALASGLGTPGPGGPHRLRAGGGRPGCPQDLDAWPRGSTRPGAIPTPAPSGQEAPLAREEVHLAPASDTLGPERRCGPWVSRDLAANAGAGTSLPSPSAFSPAPSSPPRRVVSLALGQPLFLSSLLDVAHPQSARPPQAARSPLQSSALNLTQHVAKGHPGGQPTSSPVSTRQNEGLPLFLGTMEGG
uniref:Uncharacterized protein n=1 Tax=Rangifer tarandus platyrhynchus TaxID=3082113 RepID=A0ACB0EWD2_RANTA|nr:unnamed protein product [Rangifer tarandus platyrhynchus]